MIAQSVFVLLFCAVAYVISAPPKGIPTDDVHPIEYTNNSSGKGDYKFIYALPNGEEALGNGSVKKIDLEDAEKKTTTNVIPEKVSVLEDDGTIHWVKYLTDNKGIHIRKGTGPKGGYKDEEDTEEPPK